jgi:cis-3-alkyl-4-acyloxetan-2-one decarboxylase
MMHAAAPPPLPELLIEGQGHKTLVLVHGWPDTLRIWDDTVAALKPHYRCVRFTLPGFEPGAPRQAWPLDEIVGVIERIVDQVSPGRPVTLLLHDWGCFFGYQYAARHATRVERVIGVDIGDAGSRYHLEELGPKAKLGMVSYQLMLALAWKLGGTLGDAMARRTARRLGAPALDVRSQQGYPYAMQWFGVQGGFGRLRAFAPTMPMLFIHGERKPFTFHSANWTDRVRARPGCRVIGMPTGHWVMTQRPAEFQAALLDWLRYTDAGVPE